MEQVYFYVHDLFMHYAFFFCALRCFLKNKHKLSKVQPHISLTVSQAQTFVRVASHLLIPSVPLRRAPVAMAPRGRRRRRGIGRTWTSVIQRRGRWAASRGPERNLPTHSRRQPDRHKVPRIFYCDLSPFSLSSCTTLKKDLFLHKAPHGPLFS